MLSTHNSTMPSLTTSGPASLMVRTVRRFLFARTSNHVNSSGIQECSLLCTASQSGYSCEPRVFHFPPYIRTLAQLLPRSSKGSLLNSPGHMFVFAITTIILILATTVLFFGPGITTQGIPIIIKMIEPSIAVGWSPHKLDVIVGVIAVITRLNVRIRPFIHHLVSMRWFNEKTS
jgi:hypothetical protein